MRAYKILLFSLLLSFSANAQVFTFECLCGQYAGDTCDICVINPNVESRSFSGLLIKKNGTPFKLIDAPYTIRVLKSGAIQFAELITNPEQITIARFQTQFATMEDFSDSTNCLCNGNTAAIDTLFWINGGEGVVMIGDTINVIQDTVTISNGGGLSITGTYPDYTIAQNISTDATLAGIGTPGTPLKIAQQGASTNQVLKWNGTTWVPGNNNDVSGGQSPRVPVFSGTTALTSYPEFTYTQSADDKTLHIMGARSDIYGRSFRVYNSSGTDIVNMFDNGTIYTAGKIYQTDPFTGSYGYAAGSINTLRHRTILDAPVGFIGGTDKFRYSQEAGDTSLIIYSVYGVNNGIGGSLNGIYQTPLELSASGIATVNKLRILGSIGSSTAILGRNASGFVSNIGIGTGIGFSGGTISNTGDLSTTNELQTISTGTNTLTLSNSGGTVTVDTDPTNDLTTTTNFAGDVTGLYNNLQLGTGVVGPTELASTSVTAGTYGNGFTVPVFTVDADGRITGVTNTAITAGGSNWTVSGSDIYRNSNVAIGTTSFAGAKLNVENLGSSNIGLRLGGGAMPSFGKLIELSGSGTGAYSGINSTLTSLGNVIYRLSNEGTTSGSNSLVQIATGGTSGGDPLLQFSIASGGVSVIGLDNSVTGEPLKIQPYTIVGAGTLGMTMTSAGKFGITDDTPEVTLDMAQNTDGISLPSGTTAQRPGAALPIIRFNSTFGGPEYRDGNGAWGRIGCTSFPTFSFGNGAGTDPFPLATTTNDMGGAIAVNTGTSPVTNGTFVTVTFGQGFSKTPHVTICDGNNAASNAKFIVDTISTVSFVIKVNGTLTAATDYILRYTVTN